jgi:hypothetical protein
VTGVAWLAVTRIEAGEGVLVQRIGDGQAQVRYSVAGQSRGRVTLCGLHRAQGEEERGSLGLASK